MLSFYAFRHMSLSDASVIIFSTPVFVVIFAHIFLKEPCGVFNLVTIFFTLMGVVLITRPPLLFDTMDGDKFESRKPLDLFQNGTTVDLIDGLSSGQEGTLRYSTFNPVESEKKFDIWGPVAAISSTLFGAVRNPIKMIN